MIRNFLLRAAMLLALLLPAAPVLADQSGLCFPTTGTLSGLTLVTDLNAALQALVTSNSGSSAPANPCGSAPLTGQLWLDGSTSPAHVRMYDGANWLDQGALDASNHLWEPPVGGGIGSLASASTTNLGSVAPAYVAITGTTTITSFGSAAQTGTVKFIRFAGALTLTYNGTSLITPTAASITTAAGDHAIAAHMGGGNWRIVDYLRADGTPLTLGAGQVTSAKIAANTIANSNLAQMAGHTYKGNNTGSTANAADVTTTQLTADLNPCVGDSGSGGTKGLVPAPSSGSAASGSYLSAGCTFSQPSGMYLLSTGTPTASSTAYIVTGLSTSCHQLQVNTQAVGLSLNTTLQVAISSDNGSSYDTPVALNNGTSQNNAVTIYATGVSGVKEVFGVGAGLISGQFTSKTGLTNALELVLGGGTFNGSGTVNIYCVK